jgi:hypothetical protein
MLLWERVRVRAGQFKNYRRAALTPCPSPKGRGEILSEPVGGCPSSFSKKAVSGYCIGK